LAAREEDEVESGEGPAAEHSAENRATPVDGAVSSQDYHDRISSRYQRNAMVSRLSHLLEDEFAERNLAQALRRIHGRRVLDAGGGDGRWAEWLARRDYAVTLVDNSEQMLRLARKRLAKSVAGLSVQVLPGDVRDLCALNDSSFDLVYAQGDVLSYCGSPADAVREFARLLVPRGVLVASVDNLSPYWIRLVSANRHEEAASVAKSRRSTTSYVGGELRLITHLFSPNSLGVLLREAGFTVCSVAAKAAWADLVDTVPASGARSRALRDRLAVARSRGRHSDFALIAARHIEATAILL